MKSSLWVICAVTLLCFAQVRCFSTDGDEDYDDILDKTSHEDVKKVEREGDSEVNTDSSFKVLDDYLTKKFGKLSRIQNTGEAKNLKDETKQNADDTEGDKPDNDETGVDTVNEEETVTCDSLECENDATCEEDDPKCICSNDYTGEKCEIDIKKECKEKYPKCSDGDGTCTNNGNEILCTCPGKVNYNENTGCIITSEECDAQNPKCSDGSGTCSVDGDKLKCTCPGKVNYNGKTGCKITSEECDTQNPRCSDGGGTCSVVGDILKCTCPGKVNYNTNTGCTEIPTNPTSVASSNPTSVASSNPTSVASSNPTSVASSNPTSVASSNPTSVASSNPTTVVSPNPTTLEATTIQVKDYCNEVCGEVKCDGDPTKKDAIKCLCEDDDLAFDKTDKRCKTDKCKEKCGISFDETNNKDLNCTNGPFGDVKCQCKDTKNAFDTSDKECKIDYCKEICPSLHCTKKFNKEEIDCKCSNQYDDFDIEEKKCRRNYCRQTCGTADRVECIGDKYKNTVECKCNDDEYAFKSKLCRKKCTSNDDCSNEGKCVKEKEKEYSLCNCEDGTIGDTCDTITDCVTGKYKYCKGDYGHCTFKSKKSVCECSGEKKLYGGYCTDKCEEDKDCEGSNKKCNDEKFCVCEEGYEGGDCQIVTGCDKLEAKCKDIDTKCILDDKTKKATCECKMGYFYDKTANECKDRYCNPNPCQEGECKFDDSIGSGFCNCSGSKYYNYETNKCEDIPDKCSIMKSSCGPNYKCENGQCKCKYSQNKDEECKPKLCELVTCFTGGKCSEEDGSCYCEKGKYFKDKKCQDVGGKCVLDIYKTNCTCPTGMERSDGGSDCVPKKDTGDLCSKECGYGLCVKKKDGKETCKCFKFADEQKGKCVLDKNYCSSGILQEGLMKCNCTSPYKQADDGITCKPTTCEDDDVIKMFDSIGAQCKMDYTLKTSSELGLFFVPECPTGYDRGDGKCTDPCSISKIAKECSDSGKFCYNSFSSENKFTSDCKCPPTIEEKDGQCSELSTNSAYLIENIPVLKNKYELKSGINKVVLNKDLMQSMKTAFGSSQFEYGYLYDFKRSGDILQCSFWMTFKTKPTDIELLKIKLLPKKFTITNCENCDAVVLAPSLLLSENGLKEVNITPLKSDSDKVGEMLCGKGATWSKNTCRCKEGFRVIPCSVKEIGSYNIKRCEDINECDEDSHSCSENTECVNTLGSYRCDCKPGFKKEKVLLDPVLAQNDKSKCVDMCTPSPCKNGKCSLNKDKSFNCQCNAGYGGSVCDRKDENYASAKKGTVVVGAVLGTILALAAVAFLYYIIKIRKNSGSEDFHPAPRMDRAEMTERRPMRGISNRGYE